MNLPRAESAGSGAETAPVYRFDDVTVDLARQQLRVAGVEVACQPLAFRLLVMLCEARGALVSRSALFERLWPGGQDIGDTALTQLIWRLRGALGPAADAIRTVRRGGLRLDAEVQVELPAGPAANAADAEPALPDAAGAADPVDSADAAVNPALLPTVAVADAGSPAAVVAHAARPPRPWRTAVLFLLLAGVLAATIWLVNRDRLVSSEYALHVSDLDAGRSDTADLLRLAFAAERAADTGRARELLLQVAELDTRSPVAPALLAIYSFGEPAKLEEWSALAKARVHEQTPPYTRLLVELSAHLRQKRQGARRIEDAMLDMRPNAWRLHLALAHQHMVRREFANALAAYRRVPLDALGPGVIVYVLGDRASLGDADSVAAELDAGRLRSSPMLDAYVRTRLAYTRADYAGAIAAADHALALADAERAYDNAISMAEIGALAAFQLGRPDTLDRFRRLLARCDESRSLCRARTLGFLALLAAGADQSSLAADYFGQAWDQAKHGWEKATLQLVALQSGLTPRESSAAVAARIESDPSFVGHVSLLHAWQAFADGDRVTARSHLDRARSEGVEATYLAEFALLLGARLGEDTAPCRVDPPFPNNLRVSACVELARRAETVSAR